jgi:ethanolamine-phosphate cytidylyltransferase
MDGCFDMMHYGHANAMRQAKALGDELVLGLIPDSEILMAKGPPVMNDAERKTMVESVKWVDEVIEGAPPACLLCVAAATSGMLSTRLPSR